MTTSEQINEIATALAMAQGMMGVARKDSENPYFKSKYADLASVWDACRGPLSKNGLAIVQFPSTEYLGTPEPYEWTSKMGEKRYGVRVACVVSVVTRIAHTSGQWMEAAVSSMLSTGDPQAVGSAVTYLRRYALQSVAGVAPEEDDAEAAQGRAIPVVVKAADAWRDAAVKAPSAVQTAPGTTTVASVGVKAGTTKGKPWKRFQVKFTDGREGSTFDSKLGEAALEAKASGASVDPNIEQAEKGPNLLLLWPVKPAERPLEPKVEKGPEEPVEGPEKVLTGRKITRQDGQVYYILQTSKRTLYTDQEQHAAEFKQARADGLGVVPDFYVAGGYMGLQQPVNVLRKLVVEHSEASESVARITDDVAEEFTREPGDDDAD